MKERLLGSLVLGATAAAIVIIYDDKANHAALAAAAARNHTTVISSLVSGFAGVTLFVALVVFVFTTVLGAPRRARARRAAPQWNTAAPQRRRAGARF